MTESTTNPLTGLWMPNQISHLYYGPGSVNKHLLSALPSETSKAFIITGNSLATKSPLIKQVESLLGSKRHAGTFSNISQHAPVAEIDKATNAVREDSAIDTIISIGGGSPIDSAKAISYRVHEKTGSFLHHVTIPTTLSAAECTFFAGYTTEEGVKSLVKDFALVPKVIIYDADFVVGYSPVHLYLSTGIRAVDHAVELSHHPNAAEAPTRPLLLAALRDLFVYLPKHKSNPTDKDVVTKLQLASFNSLYGMGLNTAGGLGLSHSLGYALGSPYGIPHGVTSCLTLPGVVRLMAEDPGRAAQLARIRPFVGKGERSGDDREDARAVADAIGGLVRVLGLEADLGKLGVDKDQLPLIVKRGTGGNEELGRKVRPIVEALW